MNGFFFFFSFMSFSFSLLFSTMNSDSNTNGNGQWKWNGDGWDGMGFTALLSSYHIILYLYHYHIPLCFSLLIFNPKIQSKKFFSPLRAVTAFFFPDVVVEIS